MMRNTVGTILFVVALAASPGCSVIETLGRMAVDEGKAFMEKRGHTNAATHLDGFESRMNDKLIVDNILERLAAVTAVGDPSAYGKIGGFLTHEVASVRSAALHALRADESVGATLAVVDRLQKDGDDAVRKVAAQILYNRSGTEAHQALDQAVQHDGSPSVRRAILEQLLGESPRTEKTRELLRIVGEKDDDPGIRAMALAGN